MFIEDFFRDEVCNLKLEVLSSKTKSFRMFKSIIGTSVGSAGGKGSGYTPSFMTQFMGRLCMPLARSTKFSRLSPIFLAICSNR